MNLRNTIIVLSLLVILSVSGSVIAQTATPPSGSGTEVDPYQIATLDNLYWLSQQSSSSKNFIQTADINAAETKNWDSGSGFTPIAGFTGKYNGQGHKIDSLTISRADNIGMFGLVSNTNVVIENLGLTNVNILGNSYVGALIGKCYSAHVKNCYSTGKVESTGEVGGLIGGTRYAVIENCYSSVDVKLSAYKGGGLIGFIRDKTPGTIVKNCYSTGSVTNTTSGDAYTGGLIGALASGTVENSYSSAVINTSAFKLVGGLVGYAPDDVVKKSFWDVTTSKQSSSQGGGAGKPTAVLRNFNTYIAAGWDFVKETENGTDDLWEGDEDLSINGGYPILTWQSAANGENGDSTANGSGGSGSGYTLTLVSDGNGTVTVEPVKDKYDENDDVFLNVIPNEGYAFSYWEGGDRNDWNDGMLPKPVTMDANKTFLAHFVKALPAFPGAEGGGAYTVGGRGGKVIEVTNLNSEGAGSFREACLTEGPRTIVFRVGGTIDLEGKKIVLDNSNGKNYDNLTIAGQTAPGGGIQLKNGTLNMSINDVIVRYLRFRTGPLTNNPTTFTAGALVRRDRRRNYIFDHVSAFWGVNKTVVLGGFADNITIQWSIVAEGLHESTYTLQESWEPYKVVDGLKYWAHSRGLMVHEISRNVSIHHNLLYNFYKRNPLIQSSDAEVVNNVIVNKQKQTYVQPFKGQVRANFIGNYYRSYAHIRPPIRVFDYNLGWDGVSACYYKGNYDKIFRPNSTDAETKIRLLDTREDTKNDGHISDRDTPFVFTGYPITVHEVHQSYNEVLATVGASLPSRDAADTRVVDFVKSGKAPSAFVNDPSDVGGWPTIAGGDAPADTDHDGMSDAWETEKGLNPNDATDGNATNLSSVGYTNLEVYLDDIIKNATSVNEPVVTTNYSYKLDNNYPNPFNPSTVISFSLAEAGLTKLTVYNILGEKIVELVNQEMPVGSYRYQFNGSNLSSGIYFYKLQSNNYTAVKKMMLIK